MRAALRRRVTILVLVALAVPIIGAGLVRLDEEAGVRVGVRSLAAEWWRCIRAGQPPQAQEELAQQWREQRAAVARRSGIGSDGPLEPTVPRDVASLAIDPVQRVTVAVVDSGVAVEHPAFADTTFVPGVDVLNVCGDGTQDPLGHGTAVAGVVSAVGTGAAPNARIMPVRAFGSAGPTTPLQVSAGIVAAVRGGADVVNVSYSSQVDRLSLRAAVLYAERHDVVVVASGGNNPFRKVGYPAALPTVLAVSATTPDGRPSAYAVRSATVDVAAPGSDVITVRPGRGPTPVSGTSIAAPMVTSVVAQLRAAHPELTAAQVRVLLADAVVPDADGFPRLDVDLLAPSRVALAAAS